MTVKGRQLVYLHENAEGPDVDRLCRGADIVIAAFPLRRACASVPVRIDRFDVWRDGAHALAIRGGAIEVTTAADLRGLRPWTTPPVARSSIRAAGFEETWE